MAHRPAKKNLSAVRREKGLPYFAVLDALETSKGCVLCALEVQAMGRYFDSLLSENVNNPDIRRELLRSGGYCARHTRWVLEKRDPLGTAIIYRDQAASFAESLGGGKPHVRKSVRGSPGAGRPQCPGCIEQTAARKRYVEVLCGGLAADDDFRSAFVSSAGLCRPHLAYVIEKAADSDDVEFVIDAERAKMRSLVAELDEFIRKQDYRFAGEAIGAEADSWRRAAEMIAGDARLF
jgi:hypothetical protein